MLDIISKLTICSNYRRIPLEDCTDFSLFANREDSNQVSSYFVIQEITPHSPSGVISQVQSRTFISLKNFFSENPNAEKNTTLIFLIEKDDINSNVNKEISDIEEDPYFFKKHVIQYSNEEKKLLNENIIESDPIKSIENVLYNKERFLKFCSNDDDQLYSIVAKLYAKLPFLTIREIGEVAPDLSGDIAGKLTKKGILDLRGKLLNIVNDEVEINAWIEEKEID